MAVKEKSTVKEKEQLKLIVKKKSLDYGLLIVVLVLLAIGLVMILSASAPYSLRTEGDGYFYVKKQLMFAVIGIVSMLVISKLDYRILNSRLSYLAYIGGLGLMSLVLVPGVGVERNGALRWVNLAGFQFQPSEIMKICLILMLSTLIVKNPEKIKKFWVGLVPLLCTVLPVFGLLVIQDHLSAMMITAVIVAVIIFTAGAKVLHLVPIGGAGAAAAFLYAYTSEFRRKRLMIFLDPWQDPRNNGWQIIQSLYAIGSGGLFGVGLGKGVQKYMYIAEPHNDFILATWAEETGLMGVIFVILLFAIFIWRGIVIAMKAPDMFGSLLAMGITGMIGIQAIFNIAVISSSMPVTGISLPFFSYGGSALVILLSSVGLLLSVSRHARQH